MATITQLKALADMQSYDAAQAVSDQVARGEFNDFNGWAQPWTTYTLFLRIHGGQFVEVAEGSEADDVFALRAIPCDVSPINAVKMISGISIYPAPDMLDWDDVQHQVSRNRNFVKLTVSQRPCRGVDADGEYFGVFVAA